MNKKEELKLLATRMAEICTEIAKEENKTLETSVQFMDSSINIKFSKDGAIVMDSSGNEGPVPLDKIPVGLIGAMAGDVLNQGINDIQFEQEKPKPVSKTPAVKSLQLKQFFEAVANGSPEKELKKLKEAAKGMLDEKGYIKREVFKNFTEHEKAILTPLAKDYAAQLAQQM